MAVTIIQLMYEQNIVQLCIRKFIWLTAQRVICVW